MSETITLSFNKPKSKNISKELKVILSKHFNAATVDRLLMLFKRYKSFKIQSFLKRPYKWIQIEHTGELSHYMELHKGFNHREIMHDEIIIDVDSENKTYGKVHMAALEHVWNRRGIAREQWDSGGDGFHCLPQKEKVIIKENNKIRQVELRSVVSMLQHNKTVFIKSPTGWTKVIAANSREQRPQEKLCKFALRNGTNIVCSQDHRFPVLSNQQQVLKEAKDITINDRFIYNFNKYDGNVMGTYSLGRFVGLFLAEGCYIRQGVTFTFDKTEMDYAEFLKSFGNEFGARVTIKTCSNCIRVYVYSQGLKSLLEEFIVGRYSKDRGPKSSVYGMSTEFRQGIVNGWLEGDGDHRQYQNGVTISKGMAKAMHTLLIGLGCVATMHSYINQFRNKSYCIHIVKRPKQEYSQTYRKQIQPPPMDSVYVGIKHTNKSFVKRTKLIDIQVESSDHLFTLANGIVTHNCQFVIPSLNKVAKSDLSECRKLIIKDLCRGFMFMYLYKPTRTFIFSNIRKRSSDYQLASHICIVNKSLIQVEYVLHRKGGTKMPYITGMPNTTSPVVNGNRYMIPHDIRKWLKIQVEKRNNVKQLSKFRNVLYRENRLDSKKMLPCIRYYLGEEVDEYKFFDEKDGKKRAMFHLVSFFGHTMDDEDLFLYLSEWMDKISVASGITQDKFFNKHALRACIKSNNGAVACGPKQEVLEDMGAIDICKYCKFNRR